jgi:hypothetical protein
MIQTITTSTEPVKTVFKTAFPERDFVNIDGVRGLEEIFLSN